MPPSPMPCIQQKEDKQAIYLTKALLRHYPSHQYCHIRRAHAGMRKVVVGWWGRREPTEQGCHKTLVTQPKGEAQNNANLSCASLKPSNTPSKQMAMDGWKFDSWQMPHTIASSTMMFNVLPFGQTCSGGAGMGPR